VSTGEEELKHTHVFDLLIEMHPMGVIDFLVVHAKEGSEEAQGELEDWRLTVLDRTFCLRGCSRKIW